MSSHSSFFNNDFYPYYQSIAVREHSVLKELREHTAKLPGAIMQICPEQGQFFRFIIKLIQAKNCLEIGTFTGYSGLSIALSLPENGILYTCDVDSKTSEIAKEYWEKAGVEKKIKSIIAPALETITKFKKQNLFFDFTFIDADKYNYIEYYEKSLELTNKNGIIAVDNTFWNGKVAHSDDDKRTIVIKSLNKKLIQDDRVDITVLPFGDGLTLLRKK